MTSLFSPFDFFYFNKLTFVFLSLFLILGFSSVVVTSCKAVFLSMFNFLGAFFSSLKNKSSNKFSLLIFILSFTFLFLINFFSVFSFTFPLSSQVNLVLVLSLGFWFSFVLFSVSSNPMKFLFHFIPEGTPLPLVPLLFIIEMVSNLIRPLTLMVRLVANILAGHLLMILLSSLMFVSPLCFPLYIILNSVELCVAVIQAYIFSTMLTLYFSEV